MLFFYFIFISKKKKSYFFTCKMLFFFLSFYIFQCLFYISVYFLFLNLVENLVGSNVLFEFFLLPLFDDILEDTISSPFG